MRLKKKLWSVILSATMILAAATFPLEAAAAEDGIPIDEANFPDAEFRAYVSEHCDSNGNGRLSALEADNVKEIIIDSDDIEEGESHSTVTSLKGIERFYNLQILSCYSHRLESLDLSHNPNLKILDCHYAGLTSLDVTCNPKLESLNCRSVAELTDLNVSKNPALTELDCSACELANLNVTQNPKLQILRCDSTNITRLDISQNPELVELDCGYINLNSLNVTQNSKLQRLVCDYADITNLDVSKNSELRELHCSYAKLTNLDVSKNLKLEILSCIGRETDEEVVRISSLDVTKNTALKYLNCSYTDITNLDLSQNTNLESLWCWGAGLTTLDVSKNLKLKDLNCMDTNITSLDLRNNTELGKPSEIYPQTYLQISGCPLISLLVPEQYNGSVGNPSPYKLTLQPGQNSVDLKTIAPSIQAGKILDLKGCKKQGTVLTGLKAGQNVTYRYDYDGGFIDVTIEVSEGGGQPENPDNTAQKPTISSGEGYTTSLSEDGTSVTVAVQKGYELKDVKVNGVSKGVINTVTDLKPGDVVEIVVSKIENPVFDLADAVVTISADSYAYTGKYIKPSPTVMYDGKKLKKGTDYTVSYSNNKKIGTATVTVTGIGDYSGEETLEFKIIPKKVSIASVKSKAKKSLTVRWKKNPQATGYQVQWRKSSKFSSSLSKKVKGADATSTTIKKLSSKRKYYVRVRAYKVVNGKTYYGKWSTAKSVKVK